MNVKRGMISALLCLCALFPAPALGQSWLTLAQLRAEIASGWHETVKGQNGEVAIDLSIVLPQTDKAPVTVIHPSAPVSAEKLAGMVVTENKPGSLRVQSPGYDAFDWNGVDWGNIRFYASVGAEAPNDQAKGNPLSCREAFSLMAQKIENLTGMRSGEDFTLDVVNVGDSARETGYYGFLGRWAANGLSMPPTMLLYADVSFTYIDEDRWSLFLNPFYQKSVLYEDLPFCSFAMVRETVTKAVKSGKLKSVARMELAYTPCGKRADITQGRLTLLPTWHVYETYQPRHQHLNGPKLVLSIQDGKAYTKGRSGRFRELLDGVLGWEDVK